MFYKITLFAPDNIYHLIQSHPNREAAQQKALHLAATEYNATATKVRLLSGLEIQAVKAGHDIIGKTNEQLLALLQKGD